MSTQLVTSGSRPALLWQDRLPGILRGRRLFFLLGFAAITAGLVWQWSWLVAIGVAPVLLGFAPCVAMCALGLCAMRMGVRSCSAPAAGGSLPVSRIETVPEHDEPARIVRN